MTMRLTKLDMARVVVQALYRLPTLPTVDNIHVERMVRRKKATLLAEHHRAALKIINDGLSAGTWPTAA